MPRFLTPSKEEREAEAKLKENLADDTIYDPVTGVRMTLEEAEKGLFVAHDNQERIKSEEELQRHYIPEQVEFERIRNFILESGIPYLEDEEVDHLIEIVFAKSEMLAQYDGFRLSYVIEAKSKCYLSIALVEYTIITGKYTYNENEWQITGVAVNETMTVNASNKGFTYDRLKDLVAIAGADYSLEKVDNHLLFKYNKPATLDDFQALLKRIKGSS